MGQLFAKIMTKENEAKRKIETCHEAVNLKAILASMKKVQEQFATGFSMVDVDISELILTKITATTGKKTEEENNCLKEMQELHAIIASNLKEDIVKFKSLFDAVLKK